ncbi:hypothetical protein OAO01_02885 [Oligoflexia bacterium]|nr:hypothetical protein [Oligoflexia bacterium]
MQNEQSNQAVEAIETTVGDLIEAVAQIALEAGKTEKEGYHLASLALANILHRNKKEVDFALS